MHRRQFLRRAIFAPLGGFIGLFAIHRHASPQEIKLPVGGSGRIFTSSGTWTRPHAVNSCMVEITGAGGIGSGGGGNYGGKG